MRVHVGSENAVKVNAVKDALARWPEFASADVAGVPSGSAVSHHPRTLAETVEGATNRAKAAFPGSAMGVGIEGGLMELPGSKTGSQEVAVCALYDGNELFVGVSSGFEFPAAALELMAHGVETNEAIRRAGFTEHPRLGSVDLGMAGVLSEGRLTRRMQIAQSVTMALVNRRTARTGS